MAPEQIFCFLSTSFHSFRGDASTTTNVNVREAKFICFFDSSEHPHRFAIIKNISDNTTHKVRIHNLVDKRVLAVMR
jgi:hypothetical protein